MFQGSTTTAPCFSAMAPAQRRPNGDNLAKKIPSAGHALAQAQHLPRAKHSWLFFSKLEEHVEQSPSESHAVHPSLLPLFPQHRPPWQTLLWHWPPDEQLDPSDLPVRVSACQVAIDLSMFGESPSRVNEGHSRKKEGVGGLCRVVRQQIRRRPGGATHGRRSTCWLLTWAVSLLFSLSSLLSSLLLLARARSRWGTAPRSLSNTSTSIRRGPSLCTVCCLGRLQ